MAKDIFTRLHRCHFCGRPGTVDWDGELATCASEVCKSLAFAEMHRRRCGIRQPASRSRAGRLRAPLHR